MEKLDTESICACQTDESLDGGAAGHFASEVQADADDVGYEVSLAQSAPDWPALLEACHWEWLADVLCHGDDVDVTTQFVDANCDRLLASTCPRLWQVVALLMPERLHVWQRDVNCVATSWLLRLLISQSKDAPCAADDAIAVLLGYVPKSTWMAKNGNGHTMWHHVIRYESSSNAIPVLQILHQHCPTLASIVTSKRQENGLHLAVQRGNDNVDLVKYLVQVEPQAVVAQDCLEQTPLHLAVAQHASLETLEMLVRTNPACVGIRDCQGATPLHSMTDLATVRLLLAQGGVHLALVQDRNDRRTILHKLLSRHYRKQEDVTILLDILHMVPCPDAFMMADDAARTPLHYACEARQPYKVLQVVVQAYPAAILVPDTRQDRAPQLLPTYHFRKEMVSMWAATASSTYGGVGALTEAFIEFWQTVELLALTTCQMQQIGSVVAPADNNIIVGRQFVLHGLIQSRVDYDLIQHCWKMFPDMLDVLDRCNHTPLHAYLQVSRALVNKKQARVRSLVAALPAAAGRANTNGAYPLHTAIHQECTWETTQQPLLDAAPFVLGRRDPMTKLYPFQLAAMNRKVRVVERLQDVTHVENVYRLLRRDPRMATAYARPRKALDELIRDHEWSRLLEVFLTDNGMARLYSILHRVKMRSGRSCSLLECLLFAGGRPSKILVELVAAHCPYAIGVNRDGGPSLLHEICRRSTLDFVQIVIKYASPKDLLQQSRTGDTPLMILIDRYVTGSKDSIDEAVGMILTYCPASVLVTNEADETPLQRLAHHLDRKQRRDILGTLLSGNLDNTTRLQRCSDDVDLGRAGTRQALLTSDALCCRAHGQRWHCTMLSALAKSARPKSYSAAADMAALTAYIVAATNVDACTVPNCCCLEFALQHDEWTAKTMARYGSVWKM